MRSSVNPLSKGMSIKRSWVFLGVPVLIIISGLAFMRALYPIALNGGGFFGQDPAYQYLFASVDILQGHAPGHTDHPGTPVQSLTALLILVVWGVSRLAGLTNLDVYESVLTSPEVYLASASVTFVILLGLATYFLGRRVWQTTGSIIAAISCQLAPLVFVLVSPYMAYPTPEAALMCVSVGLMATLTPALLGAGRSAGRLPLRDAVLAGVLCGIGVAVKITFVPLVGLLILLWSFRLLLSALLAMVLAWGLGVLPIWSKLPGMFAWFHKVMTHSGLHGLGDEATFNAQQLMGNVVLVVHMFPLLYYVAAAMLMVLCVGVARRVFCGIRARRASHSGSSPATGDLSHLREFLAPLCMLVVILGQTIMVAKHPGPTYMTAVLPVAVMGAAWILFVQRMVLLPAWGRRGLSLAWLVLLGYSSITSTLAALSYLNAIHEAGVKSRDTILAQTARYNDPVLIGTFNCNFPECALWFGMLMVPEMELKMGGITPNFYHFDIFGRRLHLPGVGELTAEATADTVNRLVESGRPVFLISPPYDQLAQFRLEKLSGDRIQNLYRVKGYDLPR